MMYTFVFYRSARSGEIGPQVEQEQRFATNKTDAIKTGKSMAASAGWRLIQINDATENIIFSK